LLGLRFGTAAVRMVEDGRYGHMVALSQSNMVPVPFDKVVGGRKKVPLNSDKILTARNIGICLGVDLDKLDLLD
ncbi:MAG TPA: 6-phosphofructokinase, partial [Desulfobulbaceae bacterium]|nr:6-phosphofructokinase [Desulfobulbaceae bacterium]